MVTLTKLEEETLARVLSLLPKKPDGKYKHGAKKEFANRIGEPDNVVTMWEKRESKSFMKKLYKIASIYNVSVEWLKGETDDPTPEQKNTPTAIFGDGQNEAQRELIRLIKELTPYEVSVLLKNAQSLIECRQSPDAQ